jgi:hypothetical protein
VVVGAGSEMALPLFFSRKVLAGYKETNKFIFSS